MNPNGAQLSTCEERLRATARKSFPKASGPTTISRDRRTSENRKSHHRAKRTMGGWSYQPTHTGSPTGSQLSATRERCYPLNQHRGAIVETLTTDSVKVLKNKSHVVAPELTGAVKKNSSFVGRMI